MNTKEIPDTPDEFPEEPMEYPFEPNPYEPEDPQTPEPNSTSSAFIHQSAFIIPL